MTPTGRKALLLGLGYSLLGSINEDLFRQSNNELQYKPSPDKPSQSTLTPQQKKKRDKSKVARKARKKNRK